MSENELIAYKKLDCEREQKAFVVSKETVEKMNENIIYRCNERVKKEDLLISNGDFIFRSGSKRGEGELHKPQEILDRLICKNVIFVSGNHDRNNSLKTPIQSLTLRMGGKSIYVVHDPQYCSPAHDINLTGHVHNSWAFKQIRKGEHLIDCCNVGVDVNNFYPVDINEILSKYIKWKKTLKIKL